MLRSLHRGPKVGVQGAVSINTTDRPTGRRTVRRPVGQSVFFVGVSIKVRAASITDLVHGYMASDFSIKAKRNHAISEITQVSI